ncbi:MAG: hypothetical protein AAF871_02905 [Pseudomonadota bacterium]
MRVVFAVLLISVLTGCVGGEFDQSMMEVERWPINSKGDLFFGRTFEW